MLGRKMFTPDELTAAQNAVQEQLTAYRDLAGAVDKADDPATVAALAALEPVVFTGLAMALDRFFVHRVRAVTGKGSGPLNELEVVVESLLRGTGTLAAHPVIKLKPAETVLGLAPGDRIRLTADDFERLAHAAIAELAEKFL